MTELQLKERAEWHDANNARINYLVSELSRLCCRDFDAPQSDEYRAVDDEHRQRLSDRVEHNRFIPAQYKDHTTQG